MKNKENSSFQVSTKKIVLLILLLLPIFSFAMIFSIAEAYDIRNTLVFNLLLRLYIGGFIVFLMIYKGSRPHLIGLISCAIFCGYFISSVFYSQNKIIYLLLLVYSLYLVGLGIFSYNRNKKGSYAIFSSAVIAYALGVLKIMSIVHSDFFPFVLPALIGATIGLVISIGIVVVKKNIKENKYRIGIPAAGLIISFLFTMTSSMIINYSTDYSIPTMINFVIIDKTFSGGGYRQIVAYNFKLENEDETIEIEIPKKTYNDYEIGDFIEIALYKGSLNCSYYVYLKD